MKPKTNNLIYEKRFNKTEIGYKQELWCTLYKQALAQYIKPKDTVIDLGAGLCEFINSVNCRKKIAVDTGSLTRRFAKNGVQVIRKSLFSLPNTLSNKADVVMISNVLEHLKTKEEVIQALLIANRLLKKNGILLIIQPNIDLAKHCYWNFIDHTLPLNLPSLEEALNLTSFRIIKSIRKFLPLSVKEIRLPFSPLLLLIYLKLPEWMRIKAGQSFIAAMKSL